MEKLTIVIITKNAEKTLRKTANSIGDLGKVVVVDDYSTDSTLSIAQEYGYNFVKHHEYDLGRQRAFGLSLVISEWTLMLDSDEVLTQEVKSEIREIINNPTIVDGYYIGFKNHLFGIALRQGEYHEKLVLFKTKKGHIPDGYIHERVEVKGITKKLNSFILHYSYQSPFQLIRKFTDYALRTAKTRKMKNESFGIKQLFLFPIHMFYSRYIKDKGYKDGPMRVFLDLAFAYMEFLSYFAAYFIKNKRTIAVDCGPYDILHSPVRSGIDRLLQGIAQGASDTYKYKWFSFSHQSSFCLPSFLYSSVWLPLNVILNRTDIFLGAAGNIPFLLGLIPGIQKILFIHDFGFFDTPESYKGSAERLRRQTKSSIKRANRIVVFSLTVYRQFSVLFPTFLYKVHLIRAGADHLLSIEEKPVFIPDKTPFILYIGVVKPVKRVELLLEAAKGRHLVIVGPQEPKYVRVLKNKSQPTVQYIQNCSDNQLKWLYLRASCMIYSSISEGFCYPVLEAFSLGCRVIAFKNKLFTEYQTYFPDFELVSSIGEMKKAIQNTQLKKLRKKVFSWNEFNKKVNTLYLSGRRIYTKKNINEQKMACICVLFNTPKKEKERLQKEIEQLHFPSYTIYWIDNSGTSRGYAEGVNDGIRKGLIDGCTIFMIFNPDISFPKITAQDFMSAHIYFDVWGFTMMQDKRQYFGGEIDVWRLSGGLIKSRSNIRYRQTGFVTGSLMIMSREVIETIGFFDESFVMYYEDVDYCVRASRSGFLVGVDTSIVYEHYEISNHNPQKGRMLAHSRWKFFFKYAGIVQKIREFVRLPLTLFEQFQTKTLW